MVASQIFLPPFSCQLVELHFGFFYYPRSLTEDARF
jgi:hypothetical protein